MTDNTTKIGILLPTRGLVMRAQRDGRPADASTLLALAEQAEAGGLDSVWVGDSLVSKPRLEPVAALAAVAARTSRVRIGTAVLLPVLRHPVTLAHSLATVDVLSGGRLTVAAGVGGAFTPEQRQDWHAAGVTPESRAGRLTEAVQVMKRLWREDLVSFHGRYYHLESVTLHPRPVQPGGVPLLLGCHYATGSDAQFRRAALHADGIMGLTDAPHQFADVVERVNALAREAGRDPESLQRVFYLTVNVNSNAPSAAKEAHEFLMEYYGVDHWGEQWGPWGPAKAVARRMVEYAGAGADHLIVRFASWDQPAQLQRFLDTVVPAFRAQHSGKP